MAKANRKAVRRERLSGDDSTENALPEADAPPNPTAERSGPAVDAFPLDRNAEAATRWLLNEAAAERGIPPHLLTDAARHWQSPDDALGALEHLTDRGSSSENDLRGAGWGLRCLSASEIVRLRRGLPLDDKAYTHISECALCAGIYNAARGSDPRIQGRPAEDPFAQCVTPERWEAYLQYGQLLSTEDAQHAGECAVCAALLAAAARKGDLLQKLDLATDDGQLIEETVFSQGGR